MTYLHTIRRYEKWSGDFEVIDESQPMSTSTSTPIPIPTPTPPPTPPPTPTPTSEPTTNWEVYSTIGKDVDSNGTISGDNGRMVEPQDQTAADYDPNNPRLIVTLVVTLAGSTIVCQVEAATDSETSGHAARRAAIPARA